MRPERSLASIRRKLLDLPDLSSLLDSTESDLKALRSLVGAHKLSTLEVCLAANVCRLGGNPNRADSLLLLAYPVNPAEDAAYLRCLALVRWDQGRCNETIGLLTRARDLFLQASRPEDATSTEELLVLVYHEVGDEDAAVDLFSSLSDSLRSEIPARPWLTSRTAFTAGFCLAKEDVDLAQDSLDLGRSFLPFVQDDERLLLERLEQRALARAGHDAEAALAALRDRALSSRNVFEGLLLTIDLFAVRRTHGLDVADSLQPLLNHLQGPPAIPDDFPKFLLESFLLLEPADPWDAAGVLERIARRLLRMSNLTSPPIPFTWV